jgi:ABC-type glycerol-3-phosphate transport system substrate-binding protein
MKKFSGMITALLLILALASGAVAQDEAVISILAGEWWFAEGVDDQSGAPQGYTLMQDYMAENPGITFDIRGVPFPELDSSQIAALEARQGPDILIVNSVTVGSFIDRGYMVPLDDLIEGADLDTSVFFEGLLNAAVIDGVTYGLPVDTGTRLLYINNPLFEAAGVEHPTSWDQIVDVATQMTDSDAGVYGFVATSGERWLWLYEHAGMYANANGLQILNDNATECVLNQGENTRIIQFWMDMVDAGVLNIDDLMVGTGAERELAFGNNRAAMYLGGFWSANALSSDYGMEYPEDYSIVALEGDAGTGSTTGGWIIGISRDAANPEAAMDFIKYLLTDAENLAALTDILPSTEAASQVDLQEEFYDPFKALLDENTYHPIPLNPGLPEQAEILRNVTQSALLGDMTAQEAADSFCDQVAGTLREGM